MKWSLAQLLDKKTTPPKIIRVHGKRTVADSSWMHPDPQPKSRARMSSSDMNSTVLDSGQPIPRPFGLNETENVSGEGFNDPSSLRETPVGGTRRKQDNKGGREYRRDKASCYYDSKARHRFTVSIPSQLKSELFLD